jgi:hypothetical protein
VQSSVDFTPFVACPCFSPIGGYRRNISVASFSTLTSHIRNLKPLTSTTTLRLDIYPSRNMPATNPPPQTLRQAKRAYQKSGKVFKFTASQERAAARRNAKDEYARKLREKEDRAKNNKRKREEKEAKERQAKRILVETGQLPKDALLPKVRSSQPRLSAFLRQPKKAVPEPVRPLSESDQEDHTVMSEFEADDNTLVNDCPPEVPALPKMDETELEEFFSSISASEDKLSCRRESPAPPSSIETSADRQTTEDILSAHTEHDQSDMNVQLGFPLSQALLDFDICEDPLSDSEHAEVTKTSPRKRMRVSDDFATPNKSARSALVEMSPGKVLLRSQEKPDTTSVPSIAARMLSPVHQLSSSQLIQDTLAMISTSDIADDLDIFPAKENADPMGAASSQRCSIGGSRHKSICDARVDPGQSTTKSGCVESDEQDYFDDLVDTADLDELLGDDDEHDEFDNGISDADWAGLSTQLPKNTAVSIFGSPKKAKISRTPQKTMAPPPRPSPVANLVTKLKAATPKKPTSILTFEGQRSSTANRSLIFDNDISGGDFPGLPNGGASRLRTLLTPKKASAPGPPTQQEVPTASQSFGMNDGMDDDLLALVEELDPQA